MLVIANWKMNPLSLNEAFSLINFYKKLKFSIWVAPPFVFLYPLIKKFKNFEFGSQNVHYEEKGAYTGEVSPLMLKKIGVKFTIINHSERRKLGENLFVANLKLKAVLRNNLKAVVCFGEDKVIKSKNELKEKWRKDFSKIFEGIDLEKNKNKIILAYEPSWAISTNKLGPAPSYIVEEFINWIKPKFKGKILYGGSVFPETIDNYLSLPLDGFLIGSQSLNPKNFKIIIEKIKKVL